MLGVGRASTPFKSGDLKPLHLNQTKVDNNDKSNDKEEVNKGDSVKHLNGMKNVKKNHRMKNETYQNQYNPSGQQKAYVPQSAFKEFTKATKSLRVDGSISSGYSLNDPSTDDDYGHSNKKHTVSTASSNYSHIGFINLLPLLVQLD